MKTSKRDYVEIIYNELDRPLTGYPNKLCVHLVERFNIAAGQSLLDVGCGRGEFLKGFMDCGVIGFGVDQSDSAKTYCPQAELKISDIEKEGIPFPNDYFDVVFSKSVIEHFYYPEVLVNEIHRVLKPGGLIITLCPSWEYNYRMYFEDYTHRTPFMLQSLKDIQLIHGFDDVEVFYFRQLPISWGKFRPLVFVLAEITRIFTPNFLKKYSKWIRFSKEIMLLSCAKKPVGTVE